MNSAVILRTVAAVVLGATPMLWVALHRGVRRDRNREGVASGITLLVSLLLAFAAWLFCGVATMRLRSERDMQRATVPVEAEIERCGITESRSGGRNSSRVYGLWCEVRVAGVSNDTSAVVSTGFITRRALYERWQEAHPPGTTVGLRMSPEAGRALRGFEQVAPSTTTSVSASWTALWCGLGAVFFLIASISIQRRNSIEPVGA
jgi:hypothetical protein